MYCTVAAARAAGATGTDPEVEAAIALAVTRVDRRTGTWWEPRDVTVRLRVGPDGWAPCSWVIQSVDSVTPTSTASPLAESAYAVLSSETPGSPNGVSLRSGGAHPLVAGAEPWAGGYANLLAAAGDLVDVAGEFGPAATPPEVAQATALLAAWITETDAEPAPVWDVDAEGNSLTITRDAQPAGGTRPSTGLPAADALLDALHGSPRVVLFS